MTIDDRREDLEERDLMCAIGAVTRVASILGCMAVFCVVHDAYAVLAVWPVVWLFWQRIDDRLPLTWTLELAPFVIAGQIALDCVLPYAGELAVLIGNVALVASVRRPKLPPAILLERKR